MIDEQQPDSPDPSPASTDSPSEELATPAEESIVNKPAAGLEETPPPLEVPQPTLDDSDSPAVGETPSDADTDSLFDAPEAAAPVPENSTDDSPAADLFDAPAADLEDSPAVEVFEEPIAAEDQPAEVDPLDEAFPSDSEETEVPTDPAPFDSEETNEAEETEPPVEFETPEEEAETPGEEEAPSLDDLFGQHRAQPVLNELGGLESHAVRRWTDDGARFHCDARLQQVTAKTVILLKDNGKRIAVLFSRLSDNDLQFIQRQVVAQRQLLAQPEAGQQLASLLSE